MTKDDESNVEGHKAIILDIKKTGSVLTASSTLLRTTDSCICIFFLLVWESFNLGKLNTYE